MENTNKPTFIVFFIKEIKPTNNEEEKKSIWTRIGAAWELESGRINTVLNFTPTGKGTIQLVPADLLKENT